MLQTYIIGRPGIHGCLPELLAHDGAQAAAAVTQHPIG